jgi:N-methylhydantoinase A
VSWRIGADVGGTFTDIVALAPDGGLHRMKVLSTVEDYSLAIRKALTDRLPQRALADVTQFVHGTTVATNAILEETRCVLALITTKGFRDVLEIRRARRPTLYDLTWTPPAPLIDRPMRFEVKERIDGDGSISEPLDEEDVRRIARLLREANVEAVAVCLLNSHRNPVHELRIVELLQESLAEVPVTLSSLISPESGEFERTSTTAVNALLLPVIDQYIATLEKSLKALGIDAPLQIMQSDATTAAAAIARERPFLVIESGPAAGVSAAVRLAVEMGREAVVTFDMGGTTAKASLVEGNRIDLTEELEVGDSLNQGGGFMRGAGYMVRSPCVDLTEVGSGGGSIAWIDGGGVLRVGPRSAGSTPGPACYGAGGSDATVTDAHVVLGYLNPTAIAGGSKALIPERAHEAVAKLAGQLGLSTPDTAFGIFTIATATMRRAVRAVSVERGRDVREHSLMAFGGAGGIHAAALASEMDMHEVIVPFFAGLFSSLGLLSADAAVARVASHAARLDPVERPTLEAQIAELTSQASSEFITRHGKGVSPSVEVHLSMRYVGQASTLTLRYQFAEGDDSTASTAEAFHDEHARTYGQASEGQPIEITAIRVRAFRSAPALSFAEIAARSTESHSHGSARELYFGRRVGFRQAPIISRVDLSGSEIEGPFVIEESDSTILVPPGAAAQLDSTGSIVMRLNI